MMVHGPTTAAAALSQSRPADCELVARLLAGDEPAFERVFGELQPLLLRLAGTIVRDSAVSEEVTQDTWLAVLEGLPNFEGRSSLKTWVVRILLNRARTRAARERRSLPFSALAEGERAPPAAAFNAEGAWCTAPRALGELLTPERLTADRELSAHVQRAIAELPEQQRLVIELRDVAELDAADVCSLLGLSDANQRVLLHRARHRLRAVLAEHLR
ncbi:MAG: RNA polymerase sigma factor [Polyangiales bacterium]